MKIPGLPPKWTHAEFLEELVYDFLLPGQTRRHVDVLRCMDDSSLAWSVWAARSFSLHGSQPGQSTDVEDDSVVLRG